MPIEMPGMIDDHFLRLTLDALAGRVIDLFGQQYGKIPSTVVAAPGRVNLIGEHIDYNDGLVLPMAIERYVVIAASPWPSGGSHHARLATNHIPGEVCIPLTDVPVTSLPQWTRYVWGVIRELESRQIACPSFDALIMSTVPVGAGLSSSAALEVATATLVEALAGTTIDARDKALACQRAEQVAVGVPCGMMDQFCSVMGRVGTCLLIDCQSLAVEHVPLDDPEVTVLITDSLVKHQLSAGEYAVRRQECTAALGHLGAASYRDTSLTDLQRCHAEIPETLMRRARHVITEIERVRRFVHFLRARDWAAMGCEMAASHASLRDDFAVSCPEVDQLVELTAQLDGVWGTRMTGGGFGGCTVTLVRADRLAQVARTCVIATAMPRDRTWRVM